MGPIKLLGARFKMGLWLVNLRAITFPSLTKINISQYMGNIFCATFQKEHLKLHKKCAIRVLNNYFLIM